jgi:hypothetical protein
VEIHSLVRRWAIGDEQEKVTQITLSAKEKAFLKAHPVVRVHNEKDFFEEVLTKSFPQINGLPVKGTLAGLKAVTFGRADAALDESAVMRTSRFGIRAAIWSKSIVPSLKDRSSRRPNWLRAP